MAIRDLKPNQVFMMDGEFYIVRCMDSEHMLVERMANVGPNQYKPTGDVEEILLDEMEVA